MEKDAQEGGVDVEAAVVSNEAQLSEFSHEIADTSAGCANLLRQHFLRYVGKHFLGFFLPAVPSELQKSARQPFLAGIEKLVDQVVFDPAVAFKHIRDEAVGKRTFNVEHADHLVFLNGEHKCPCERGGRLLTNRLTCQTPFTKKITWSQNCHNCFSANLVDNGEFHFAFLNVHDIRAGITLR